MSKSRPSEEIQSLLDMLFVQDHEIFKGLPVNLQRSRLNGADLRGAHLEKAVLAKAYLQGADLSGAYLQGANLREARLQRADLRGAHLQGADLSGAQLQGAMLWETHLQGATLRSARLQGADLWDAHLQGADLPGAHLQGAELFVAQLQGTNLYAADLRGVVSQVRDLKKQFEERITSRTNQEDDLTGAIFEGGLSMSREDLDDLVELVPDERKQTIRQLQWHIGKPGRNKLPKDSGALTGVYTAEEAEKWIAEYNEAMAEVPEADDN